MSLIYPIYLRRGKYCQNWKVELENNLKRKNRKYVIELFKMSIGKECDRNLRRMVAYCANRCFMEFKLFLEDRELIELSIKASSGFPILLVNRRFRRDDLELVKNAVSKNGFLLKNLPKKYLEDERIVSEAVKNNGLCLDIVDRSFRSNREIVKHALSNDGLSLLFVCDDFKKDVNLINLALQQDENAIQFAHSSFRDDKEICLEVVKSQGNCLSFLSKRLQDDEDIVLTAIESFHEKNTYQSIFKHASPRLKDDRDFVSKVVSKFPVCFQHVSDRLKKDRSIIYHASFNTYNIHEIGETFLQDFEIVMYFFQNVSNWYHQQSILRTLRNRNSIFLKDQDYVLKMAPFARNIANFMSSDLRSDFNFILRLCKVVQKNGIILDKLDESLKNNREIVMAAVKRSGTNLNYVTNDALRNDREIVLEVAKTSGYTAMRILKFRGDRDIVKEAVKSDLSSIWLIRQSYSFSRASHWVNKNFKIEDLELLKFCVRCHGEKCLKHFDEEMVKLEEVRIVCLRYVMRKVGDGMSKKDECERIEYLL